MPDVAVVAIARTPCGRAHKGSLRDTSPDTLAAQVIEEVLARAGRVDPAEVEDVVLGCAMPEAEQGMNIARMSSHLARLPDSVPGMTINRLCSSGLQSLAIAGGRIALGGCDTVLAGGVESMSMVPMGGNKPTANAELLQRYPQAYTGMGITAENIARQFNVTRAEQDAFALESQKRAASALAQGRFDEQTVPIKTTVFEHDGPRAVTLSQDETPRPDTNAEGLAALKPVFSQGGTVTAGNSSPLTDGAGCALLMSLTKAKRLRLKPLGIFRHFVVVGVPPEIMGIGPVPAIRKLMQVSRHRLSSIDVFEINEAFAAQAAYCVRELKLNPAKVNPNGGAIALGHPLGATGTMLTAKLLYELKRVNGRFGVVSMCIGGGMGAAGLFERI